MNKKIILTLFVFMALAQIYVPSSMIWDSEKVLETGTEFKFRIKPVDPTDPFRGKYIVLNFEANRFKITKNEKWYRDEQVYVMISNDNQGFAKIESISKTEPENMIDFVKASVNNAYDDEIIIDYPFEKYFMEESKAKAAEDVYRKYASDSSKTTYVLVSVKDGNALIKDILIDDVSINKLVEECLENQ